MRSNSNNRWQINPAMIMRRRPAAFAAVKGSESYPQIDGIVRFYKVQDGTVVCAEISGLPTSDELCGEPVLGFHIHEGDMCEGNETDPFADAMTHFNPDGCSHPHHAGDLPPLFVSMRGFAFTAFFTDRFTVDQIIGKTVIIHSNRDDFTTQPSGDSGEKIACGEIKLLR